MYKGKKRVYFPDFLVVKNDMREYLYEVKAFDKTEDETNKIKFQVGMKYCSERNMKYVVITEKDIRKGFLIENLDLLSEVRPESTSWKVKNHIIRILDGLGGKTSIKNLKTTIDVSDADLENNIFDLIYTHQLKTDLVSVLINDNCIIERVCN
ncbi:Tn7 transposase TnsA N-terminal domain-containing protein [Schinkia sp. CFF1]